MKVFFSVLIIAISSTAIKAQISFSPATNFGVGKGPRSIISADFNSDGKMDLATANYFSDSISVLFGNGLGSFSAPNFFAVGMRPNSLISADFNSDGKIDIAITNHISNNISILIGDGLGNFLAAVNYPAPSNPSFIKAADINGDGKTDLMISNDGGTVISIYMGTGLGTFLPFTSFGVAWLTYSFTLADFNGDSKLDLAIANTQSWVSIMTGDGSGYFNPFVTFVTSAQYSSSIISCDFNDDGKIDLATGNGISNSVSVLLGDGAGGFSAPTNIATGDARSIINADFNGDGKMDLATANTLSNKASVLKGDGVGGFSSPINFGVGAGTQPWSVISADFNGDGKMDLAIANYISDNISVLINSTAPNGLDELEMGDKVKISIYPNPTYGEFYVLGLNEIQNANLEVYNYMGVRVVQTRNSIDCNTIDLSNEANGLYFVKIINDGKVIASHKLFKE
jgi:hypothetical protein